MSGRTLRSAIPSVARYGLQCCLILPQMFKVNTSILQDIAEATHLLCGYLKCMKVAMMGLLPQACAQRGLASLVASHHSQITKPFIDMLLFYHHDDIHARRVFASCIDCIIIPLSFVH